MITTNEIDFVQKHIDTLNKAIKTDNKSGYNTMVAYSHNLLQDLVDNDIISIGIAKKHQKELNNTFFNVNTYLSGGELDYISLYTYLLDMLESIMKKISKKVVKIPSVYDENQVESIKKFYTWLEDYSDMYCDKWIYDDGDFFIYYKDSAIQVSPYRYSSYQVTSYSLDSSGDFDFITTYDEDEMSFDDIKDIMKEYHMKKYN